MDWVKTGNNCDHTQHVNIGFYFRKLETEIAQKEKEKIKERADGETTVSSCVYAQIKTF